MASLARDLQRQLGCRQIRIQVDNRWTAGILGKGEDALPLVLSPVDRLGSGVFNDQADIVISGEGAQVGFQQDIYALALNRPTDEEEDKALPLGRLENAGSRLSEMGLPTPNLRMATLVSKIERPEAIEDLDAVDQALAS